ncbi:MAG TPA: nuclease [Desulfotomaculum sp.]|jgi:micrococcal nuclease|nr:nuclease [Desulfotomaculum sp.]HCJ78441.1 nuclease [Desulfotomaculum sp.]
MSKMLLVRLFIILMILLILPAGCGKGVVAPEAPGGMNGQIENKPEAAEKSPVTALPERKGLPVLKSTVIYVVDGDTIHVRLENGRKEKVRFIGVDTPESTRTIEPYGKEAAIYTRKELSDKTIYLEIDVAQRDKYGRLLAYVWLMPPRDSSKTEVRKVMFNAALLLVGMAQVMTVPPNVKYADMFIEFQKEAREAEKGLWGIIKVPAPASVFNKANTETKYIGNSNSKKFHRPNCQWAQKIAPRNRVEFGKREEAIKTGYQPCKTCKP